MPLITSARTHPVVRGIKIGSNQPPQWVSVPSPTFTLGTASNFPPSGTYQSNGYVTDANNDTITLTWISGSITGVTWDGGKFVYSGAGSAGTTGSLVLRANDGTDIVDSSAFSIVIESNLAWSVTPSVSFVEASVTPVNLGSYVTNYNASTDEFRVTPSYSLPLWLSLTAGPGTGSGNLTPNGTQVDANDIPASPGIKIDVRRSGGAWVSSAAFGVTVTAAAPPPVYADTWTRLDQAASGGPTALQFSYVVPYTGGKLMVPWAGPKSFDPVTGMWTALPANAEFVSGSENYGGAWDETNNRVLFTTRTPPDDKDIYYNVATNDYTMVNSSFWAVAPHDNGISWYNNRFYQFQSNQGGDPISRRLRSRSSNPDGAWSDESCGGTEALPFDSTGAVGDGRACGLMYLRSGIDHRTGQAWILGYDNKLYWRGANGRWNLIPTFGTKPPDFSIAALDEEHDCIVTWCGRNAISGVPDPGSGTDSQGYPYAAFLGVTFVLNLGTLLWRQSTAANSIPQAVAGASSICYNRYRQRVQVQAGNGTTCTVWEFSPQE